MSGTTEAPAQASAPATAPSGTTLDTSAPASGQATQAQTQAPPAVGVSLEGSPAPAAAEGSVTDKPWYTALADEGQRTYAEKKGWKTIDALVKSNQELEAAFSGKMDALLPKSVDDVKLEVPKDAADFGYDAEFAKTFSQWAVDAKVPKDAAVALHTKYVDFFRQAVAADAASRAEALNKSLTDAQGLLQKEWGATDNPAFVRGLEMARRAIGQLGIADDLKAAGILVEAKGPDGKADVKVANAKVMVALAKVGAGMFSEDSLFGSSTNSSNPFDPKTLDLSAQGAIVKSDPNRARLLIASLPKADQGRYEYLLSQLKK